MAINVSEVIVQTNKDQGKSLGDYKGQVLLIVNVASRCGFTKQYAALELLQKEFGAKKFTVLAFPCNDFGNQEPGTIEEIQAFCSTNYSISFPLFEKVHAKGKTSEPFTTLNQMQPKGDVAWNFEKFLVGKDGSVLRRFKSAIEPDSKELKDAIKAALEA